MTKIFRVFLEHRETTCYIIIVRHKLMPICNHFTFHKLMPTLHCLCLLIVFFLLPASEPNLKVKHKLKKHLNTRKSPLTRKESAPPTVKHRVPDTMGNFTIIVSQRAESNMRIYIPQRDSGMND